MTPNTPNDYPSLLLYKIRWLGVIR